MKLKSLRAALAPLTKFGQDEISFRLDSSSEDSVQVYLRPLVPREEIECQKRARDILIQAREEEGEKDEVSRAAAVQYFDMFRIQVISYALVQVGDQNFRGEKIIETEETLSNGTPIKIPLNKALQDLISADWSRSMISICWTKYGELMTQIAQKAEKVVEQTLTDMDAEILRLSERLTKLKGERENRAKGDPSITMDQIKSLTNLGNALESDLDDTLRQAQLQRELQEQIRKEDKRLEEESPLTPEEEPEEEEPEQEEVPPPPRRPVTPPFVPPPTTKIASPPPQRKREPEPEFVSSFEDPDSSEALLQQERESMRILEAQRKAKEARSQDMGRDLSRAEPIGQVLSNSGKMVDAYRLPSETLSSRGGNQAPQKKDPPKGNQNPNFIPAKKS